MDIIGEIFGLADYTTDECIKRTASKHLIEGQKRTMSEKAGI